MSDSVTLGEDQVAFFRDQGYLIARGVFDGGEISRLREGYRYVEGLAERAGLKEDYLRSSGCEVHIHIQSSEGVAGPGASKFLRKIQWPAMIQPAFEEIRTSPKFPTLVEPLIGRSLKQYINQINFKIPGGEIEFPWHQDIRPTPAFRDQVNNYVQTIIAVDPATIENGCLHVIPESHKSGNLKVKRYAPGGVEAHVDVSKAVPCEADPGDVVMFTPYTVHGSRPNQTDSPRRSYINGFVRASSCDVGKWAFLDGRPVPITSDYSYHDIQATG